MKATKGEDKPPEAPLEALHARAQGRVSARVFAAALVASVLASCTTSPRSGSDIDSLSSLMVAVTAAGYSCDQPDGRDHHSDYGEEGNNCNSFDGGFVTYCPDEAVCRRVIANLRANLEGTSLGERQVLDGGRWFLFAPTAGLKTVQRKLGGTVVRVH